MKFSAFLFSFLFATFAHAEILNAADVRATLGVFKIANEKDGTCASTLQKDWFIANSSFGNSETTAQAMNHILPGLAGGIELIHIFKLAVSKPNEFRAELDRWLLKRGQVQTMTLAELKDYLKAKRNLDFPIFNSPEDEAKGFISHKAYTYAMAHGLFPIGDPHDVFFHIPAYLDPRFADALKRIAQLIFATADQPEHQALFNYLVGPMREVGVENWSYIYVDSHRRPHLFMQGNQPFFALNRIAEQIPQVPAPAALFTNSYDSGTSIRDFYKLPRWDEFAARTSARAILKELNPLLATLELTKSDVANANRRLRARMVLNRSTNMHDYLDALAAIVNDDAILKPTLSYQTRGQAAKLTLDLIEFYWKWITSEVSSSHP